MVVGAYQDAYLAGDRLKDQRRFEFFLEDVPFFGKPVSNYARATLITYDQELLAKVAGVEGVRFPDFPEFLQGYIRSLTTRDAETIAADLAAFDAFYFDPNGLRHSPLRQKIVDAIR